METNQAIVVGSGLAGLAATLELVKNGVSVAMLEKSDKLGGNSIKASSGINGAPTLQQKINCIEDSTDIFEKDTFKSGKGLCNSDLVETLVANSKSAIDWLTGTDIDVDLSKVAQLGGHTVARTHRGAGKVPPGFAIVSAITKLLEIQQESPAKLTLLKNSSLLDILSNETKTAVIGIKYESDSDVKTIMSNNIVLATGGYCADFGAAESLLLKSCPDLCNFPSSNDPGTTGDGQKIASRDVDAKLIQMDRVQIHPTGFVKLPVSLEDNSINDKWKFLSGELLRSIGGFLITPFSGKRFVNELTTRDVVSDALLKMCKVTGPNKFGFEKDNAVALLVVGEEDYKKAASHIDFYLWKGLMRKGSLSGIRRVVSQINGGANVESELDTTVSEYVESTKTGVDSFGRQNFGDTFKFDETSIFYYGVVTPVLHFSMGGVQIDKNGRVLNSKDIVIKGLYAAGEVSGGVHGGNRLGGNSLLECVVFGRIVAQQVKNSLAN